MTRERVERKPLLLCGKQLSISSIFLKGEEIRFKTDTGETIFKKKSFPHNPKSKIPGTGYDVYVNENNVYISPIGALVGRENNLLFKAETRNGQVWFNIRTKRLDGSRDPDLPGGAALAEAAMAFFDSRHKDSSGKPTITTFVATWKEGSDNFDTLMQYRKEQSLTRDVSDVYEWIYEGARQTWSAVHIAQPLGFINLVDVDPRLKDDPKFVVARFARP